MRCRRLSRSPPNRPQIEMTQAAMFRFVIVLALASLCAVSQAQEVSYAGKWIGTVATTQGQPMDVDVVIKGDTGTWRMRLHGASTQGRLNPCLERDLPAQVLAQSDTQRVFQVQGSRVQQGCFNQKVTLRLVDRKTLEGKLGDGRAVKLTR
jgi:hypothetical protein